MTDLRKAAQMVLDTWDADDWFDADTLRAALAQPEQNLQLVANFLNEYGLEVLDVIASLKAQPEPEPVAYQWLGTSVIRKRISKGAEADARQPLYEACVAIPPQRKPLTEEEIDELMYSMAGADRANDRFRTSFARAIERAHGIGEQND